MDMKEINKIHTMLSSKDEEMQNLGISLTPYMTPKGWEFTIKKDEVEHCKRILAYLAYDIAYREGKQLKNKEHENEKEN